MNSGATLSFAKEVAGLKELKTGCEHIPEVIAFSDQFLVLPFIETGTPGPLFWKNLGIQLARIHRVRQKHFGFHEDNFIGQAIQKNTNPDDLDWPGFFWRNRIEHKLETLVGKYNFRLDKNEFSRLRDRVHGFLSGHSCHPSLVHGDMWSGNVLCGLKQEVFFIDPAVYYGDREVDLAMTECFGGFDPVFYRAYHEAYPLSEGYERRKSVYNLFHILNHFVIFGHSYRASTVNLIGEIIQ